MELKADESGFVERIEADEVGVASLILGGGRETKDSEIDLSVGIILKKKIGDYVEQGETIAVLHGNDLKKMEVAKERFMAAYSFSKTPVAGSTLVKWIVTAQGTKKY